MKDVKGMPLNLGDELMKLSVQAASMETDSDDARARVFLLGRLAVLNRIAGIAQEQIADLVNEIRELPLEERGKWSEIGEVLGINPDAALKRFSAPGKPRLAKPGHSVSDAARRLGMSRETVYNKLRANPDADWFVIAPTGGNVLTETCRILDLTELRAARTNWSPDTNSPDA